MKIVYTGLLMAAQLLAQGPPPPPGQGGLIKAGMSDVLKLNAYADNWCIVYINGKLAAADQIEFLPHNVVTVNVLPIYPMTIAVMSCRERARVNPAGAVIPVQ